MHRTRLRMVVPIWACLVVPAAAQDVSAAATPAAAVPVAAPVAAVPADATPAVLESVPRDAGSAPGPAGQGYTYIPGGRRDPFVSLLRRGTESAVTAPAARARGLAGLRAAEVTLRGTLESQGGYVGLLRGADTRTYLVRAGDGLADGTIHAITPDSVVILQQVNDASSRERQREVRKVLRPSDEARR